MPWQLGGFAVVSGVVGLGQQPNDAPASIGGPLPARFGDPEEARKAALAFDLRRLPAEQRGAGRRAHRRGDVMVAESDALLRQAVKCRHLIAGCDRQVIARLVAQNENDVAGMDRRRSRGARPSTHTRRDKD